MTCAVKKDLTICKGKTFTQAFQWASDTYVWKPITAITQAAPAVITAVGHELPARWPVAVASVRGMVEINAANSPPQPHEFRWATTIDADMVEINSVNAADYSAYTSGGYLVYRRPIDLTNYVARMTIKDRIGGTELLTLTVDNGRTSVDQNSSIISLLISATDTAGITWQRGVYDLELVSPGGIVSALTYGKVTVTEEVTT